MSGLRDALSRWAPQRSPKDAFRFLKVAEVCSKYEGELDERLPLDLDRRVKNVLRLAEERRLYACPHVDLSAALLGLVDDSRIRSSPAARQAIVTEATRRIDRRTLRAVLHALLVTFDPKSELTSALRSHLARNASHLGARDARFAQVNGVLDEDFGIGATARRILSGQDVASAIQESGLAGKFNASRYAWMLKGEAVASALAVGSVDRLRAAIAWLEFGNSERWGADRAAAYEWLLHPFADTGAEPQMQREITQLLLRRFGDPRTEGWPPLDGPRATARSEVCQATLRKWLALDQLDLFIKIIQRTAVERMFKARRAFWLPYFKEGLVSDVTLIAAKDADREARKVEERSGYGLTWATLSGAQPSHSVLLIRLDRLIIAEWSHDGKMRFWHDRDEAAPEFHLERYHRTDLTTSSLTIPGLTNADGIIHHPDGIWQRRAAETIEYFTGVRI